MQIKTRLIWYGKKFQHVYADTGALTTFIFLINTNKENSRNHFAVRAKLRLIEAVSAVSPHQVVRMRSVRLVFRNQVNAHHSFTSVVQDLREKIHKH